MTDVVSSFRSLFDAPQLMALALKRRRLKSILVACLLQIFPQTSTAQTDLPRLLPPVSQGPGKTLIRLVGNPGAQYALDVSTDLLNWQEVTAGPAVDGELAWVDTTATASGRRFFRGRTTGEQNPSGAYRVVPQVDTNLTAQAEIGPEGGAVEVVTPTGVRFRLSVPPQALFAPETITVTVLKTVDQLPLRGAMLGAVVIGPEGLLLLKPAELEIQNPATPASESCGFGFASDGGEFHLVPGRVAAGVSTLWLHRLGGVGAAVATRAEVRSILEHPPTSAAARLEQTLAGAGLQRRLPGGSPVLVRRAEAVTALSQFYATRLAGLNPDVPRLADVPAAEAGVEIVLESITIHRNGVEVYREEFPAAEPGDDPTTENQVVESGTAVLVDACAWAQRGVASFADRCGQLKVADVADALILLEWLSFQCDSEVATQAREQLRGCLNFALNFESHIVTDAEEVVIESKVHASRLPLQWGSRGVFSGVGTLTYDSFVMTPPPSPCSRDGLKFEGGVFHILSLRFDLNFKKPGRSRLHLKYIPPAATESWVTHCPGVDLPTPQAVMWLGAYILAHQSQFEISDWKVSGGPYFARREYLSATIHEDAFITEASSFELVHVGDE